MGQVLLLGSTAVMAYSSKLLLNFPSETNLDPVAACYHFGLGIRRGCWEEGQLFLEERTDAGMHAGLKCSSRVCS